MVPLTHARAPIPEKPHDFVAYAPGTAVAKPLFATMKKEIVAHDLSSLQNGLVTLVPELRGRACRLCGDPVTAEDIVQDTIERALRFAKQYEKGTNLRAWVYQILFSV